MSGALGQGDLLGSAGDRENRSVEGRGDLLRSAEGHRDLLRRTSTRILVEE